MKWAAPSRIALATLLSLAVAHSAEPVLQPVPDPGPILHEFARQMASVDSLALEFTQERQVALMAQPLLSEGMMLIARPDQIRWETTKPYQSILLGDHRSVAQFERTDGTWKKLRLGFPQMLRRVMEQMVQMHQGQLTALTKDYTLSVATGQVTRVTLVPKDETIRSVLAKLEVQMAPDFSATSEVVMHEPSGDFTRIRFRQERRKVKFPPGTFDQNKPADLASIRAALGPAPEQ